MGEALSHFISYLTATLMIVHRAVQWLACGKSSRRTAKVAKSRTTTKQLLHQLIEKGPIMVTAN